MNSLVCANLQVRNSRTILSTQNFSDDYFEMSIFKSSSLTMLNQISSVYSNTHLKDLK